MAPAPSTAYQELARALNSLGYDVGSVDELRRSGIRYASAVPMLREWLPRMETGDKECVVRALSVPWARSPETLRLLITEFERSDQPMLRWAIGNALEVLGTESDLDALVRLASDGRYGTARQMIVLALGKFPQDARIFDLLVRLTNDEDVVGHAVSALARLRDPRAEQRLRELARHQKAWIRRAARKGLKGLGLDPS